MKTRTTTEAAAWSAAAGFDVHLRASLYVEPTGWVSLNFLAGKDFVLGAKYDFALDTPVGQCSIELAREVDGVSLSPYVSSSPVNESGALLAPWRLFTLGVAITPLGMQPTESMWREEFRGRIDDVVVSEETVTISGRDLGAVLQRYQCEEERTYGSDSGTAMETVMGQVLDDNGLSGTVSVTTPVSPSALVKKYVQKKEPVLDALRMTLASRIGWELRYWYDSAAGTYTQLRFYEPDRENTTAAFSFSPSVYTVLGELRETGEDVRNVVDVWYTDLADLDAAGNPKRKRVRVSDSASVALYGRAWMEMAEASTSSIDTEEEAERLAEAAIADLKDAKIVGTVEVPYFPWVELGDLYSLGANGATHDEDLVLHVERYEHELSPRGNARTTLSFRGSKPTASMRGWLQRDARPGRARSAPATAPNAPTGLTSSPTAGGFTLRFDPPTTGPKAASYELHLSTSSGFTPDSSTQRGTSSTTQFDVTGLQPGATFYARVVPRSADGDRGPATSELTLTPRYVEPRLLLPRISWGGLPLNADLEANSDSAQPPDAWSLSPGATWGTDAQLTTDVLSGSAAVHFPNTSTSATLNAQPFTVREGEIWVFSAFYKQSVGSTFSGVLAFTYLDANLNAISAVSLNLGTSTPADTWTRAAQRVTIPSGARFGVISVNRSGSYGGTLTVDSMDALRSVAFEPWQLPTFENGWTDENIAVYGQVRFRRNDVGEVEFRGVARAPTPAPAAGANMLTLPALYRPDSTRLWRLVTSVLNNVSVSIDTLGRLQVSALSAGANLSLDGIRFFVD